jgi:subtilisin-like proprotein convertase family protein
MSWAQTTFTGDNLGSSITDFNTTISNANSTLTGTIGVDYVIKKVTIDINHTFTADLDIFIEAPDGTTLELTTDNGLSSNDFTNTRFQDGGADITLDEGPFSFVYEPEGGTFASTFNNVDVNGDWTLQVSDDFFGDEGTLNNFTITFDVPQTCIAPINLSVANITANSADLSWDTEATATDGYDWVLMLAGEDPDTSMPLFESASSVLTNSANIIGITPDTDFHAYVRSNCGSGHLSWWSIPVNFTTLCGIITPDYIENFTNGYSNCWSVADSGNPTAGPSSIGTSKWELEIFLNSGNDLSAVINLFSNNTEDWFLTPEFDLSAGNYELLFNTGVTDDFETDPPTLNGMGSDDEILLLITTDSGATWSTLKTYNQSDFPIHTGETEAIDLSAYTGIVQFAFWATEGTIDDPENYDFFIDDFEVRTRPACPDVINLTASNITATSVDLAWDTSTTSSSNSFDYVLITDGTIPDGSATPDGTFPSGNTGIINTLNPVTTYAVYVRSNCGGAVVGEWSEVLIFSTACGTVIPDYLEDFSTFVPNCWQVAGSGNPLSGPSDFGSSLWLHDDFLNSGGVNNSVNINLFTDNREDWLISPPIDLSGGLYELAYLAAITDWDNSNPPELNGMGSDDEVQILITTDAGATWQNLKTYNQSDFPSATGDNEVIPLSAYSGIAQFAIWATDGSVNDLEDYDFFIDDFEIRLAPTCIVPPNFSVGNVTAFEADLDWDPTPSTNNVGYEWVLMAPGDDPDADTPLFDGSTGVSVTETTVSGLSADTSYDAYVRAYCSASPDDKSAWSSVVSFTTDISCFAPENLSVPNFTATTADLEWEATTSIISEGYEWVLMAPGDAADVSTALFSGTTDSSTITAQVTGLSDGTTYDAYVRAECSLNDFSDWSAGVTFTTPCLPVTVLPWSEGFEGLTSVGAGVFPDCWSSDQGVFITRDSPTTFSLGARTGSNFLLHGNETGTSNIYMPAFELTASQEYVFSFWHRTNFQFAYKSFEVLIGTTPDVTTMVPLGGITDVQNTTYEEFSVSYTPSTTDTYYFAIQVVFSTSSILELGFDDFRLEEAVTSATDYTFSVADGYLPSSPDGVNEPLSTLTVLDGTAVLNSATVLDSITVRPGAVLDINADLTADLVFESDLTGFGQLANAEGHNITGTATVQNFIPEKRAYRSLSSPVSDVTVQNSWQQDIHISGAVGPVLGIGEDNFDPATGFDYTATGVPSMYTFDHSLQDQSSPWVAIPNTNVYELSAGQPYYVMIRGHRDTVDLTSNNSPASDVTLSATGTLHTGVFDAEFSDYQENYTLVGNPYQAIVNLNNLSFGDGVNPNFAYYWDPGIGSIGDNVEVTLSTGAPDPTSSNADQFLRPGQAVFFRNNNSGTDFSIQFNEDDKETSGSQSMVFSEGNQKYINIRLYTKNRFINQLSEEDALGIRFSDNGNNNIDHFDAVKMLNSGANISRINNAELLGIENRALPEHGEVLNLHLSGVSDNNYILFVQAENFEATQQLKLIDQYTNTVQALVPGMNLLDFSADPGIPGSTDPQRFQLLFEDETFGSEDAFFESFNLYPNPVDDSFFIEHDFNTSPDIDIFNALGQNVMTFRTGQNEKTEISVKGLSSGVYLVKITSGSKTLLKKIVKN